MVEKVSVKILYKVWPELIQADNQNPNEQQ
jgi:hypothetical protein